MEIKKIVSFPLLYMYYTFFTSHPFIHPSIHPIPRRVIIFRLDRITITLIFFVVLRIIYVCTYACMYVWTYMVYTYVLMHVCMYEHIWYISVCINVCMNVYVWMYKICMNVCIFPRKKKRNYRCKDNAAWIWYFSNSTAQIIAATIY